MTHLCNLHFVITLALGLSAIPVYIQCINVCSNVFKLLPIYFYQVRLKVLNKNFIHYPYSCSSIFNIKILND